jgi:molecular chaperone HscA
VTFRVDADGLLHVTAKELTTGVEQEIDVKPTHGLDDAAVEQMLLDALDHGEDDLRARGLAEARVEAERILTATRQALTADADLLEGDERAQVTAAIDALAAALGADRAAVIKSRIDALDEVTHGWAGRRMNRAIARAIEGKKVGDVEADVAHAEGVEAHLAREQGTTGGEPAAR